MSPQTQSQRVRAAMPRGKMLAVVVILLPAIMASRGPAVEASMIGVARAQLNTLARAMQLADELQRPPLCDRLTAPREGPHGDPAGRCFLWATGYSWRWGGLVRTHLIR